MSDPRPTHPIRSVYDFFRSLRLAVVLILVITLLSVVATLIPQGREAAFYEARYPVLGPALMFLGFDAMFVSVIYLVPVGLFFVNLLVCTVHRFAVRLRSGAKRRFGPDIIHVGLLVLIFGAVVTFFGRAENMVELRVGQSAQVPGGYVLTLEDFEFQRYADGRPKDWLSTISVTRGGASVEDRAVVEVNAPLKLGPLKFYQSTWGFEEGVVLADSGGTRYWLPLGNIVPLDEERGLVLVEIEVGESVDENVALFEVWTGHEATGLQRHGAGDTVGEWVVTGVVSGYFTGLQMVYDPGYLPVLVGLILLAVGLFLTYIQKLGDNRL